MFTNSNKGHVLNFVCFLELPPNSNINIHGLKFSSPELHAGLVEEKASALCVTRGGTTARPAGGDDEDDGEDGEEHGEDYEDDEDDEDDEDGEEDEDDVEDED